MINIPFNFQPTSVSVKTSSYTIPSGSYAYVVGNVRDGGTMTIDGTTCLASQGNVASDVVAVSQASGFGLATTYTVPSEYYFEGYVHSDAVINIGNLTVGGTNSNTAAITVGTRAEIKAGSGDVVSVQSGGTSYIIGYARSLQQPETTSTGGFWVPTGTTINGTGAFWATVSLFNEIS